MAERARSATGETAEPVAVGGEVAKDLLRVDWEATPLGPPERWPQSLRTMVRVLLTSRFSMWMAWGPELTFFCNDAYRRDTLGRKYPWALGRPASEVWAEIWPEIGPRIETVMSTGRATWDESLLLFLERSGYTEETYHTFSYSPLPDDDGRIAGMLCVVSEDTERVVGDRRMATLRDLGAVPTGRDEHEFLRAAAGPLEGNPWSLPFTTVYLFDDEGNAELACSTTLRAGHPAAPERIDAGDRNPPWPVADLAAGERVIVEQLPERFPDLPSGIWREPPEVALLVPLEQATGEGRPYGFLMVGANKYRPVDADYHSFVGLIAQRLAAGIASARSYEAERRRAEQLAELDRAKTAFFSNVSHEFRTPLTLIIGPLQDAVEAGARLEAGEVALVRRNAVRLLKLVNTLLDFSRIEAGRLRARFQPVDVSRLTAELAGTFREASRRARIELAIDCEPVSEPVYLDPHLWERIVLNLLSNAFKVTVEGRIGVELRPVDGRLELVVTDTGPGIPPAELDRLFQRFHQVRSSGARSHEGTGIGLALVKELVEMHGGEVSVQSAVGEGSRFAVRLPFGREHLPADQVSEAGGEHGPELAELFVEEALSWLPAGAPDGAGAAPGEAAPDAAVERAATAGRRALDTSLARVLIVDDNPDLRRYLTRLLSPFWKVEATSDGARALERIRADPPDLVITDVMMPGLDGFGLLAAVRESPQTRELPVIMLSARAGEEASIEGLRAGADDYLPKPFSGRELVARVRSHLELSLVRREASEQVRAERLRLRQTLDQLPAGVILAEAPDGRIILANKEVEAIMRTRVGERVGYAAQRLHTPAGAPVPPDRVPLARATFHGEEVADAELLYDAGDGRRLTLRMSAGPIRDDDGRIVAGVVVFQDVSEHVRTQRLIAGQRDIMAMIAAGAPLPSTLHQIVRCAEALSEHGGRAAVLLRGADGRRVDGDAVPSGGEGGEPPSWSTPIQATNGELVGTFAICHDEPREPSAEDRRVVELLSRTAAVAIERSRDAEARSRRLAELQSSLLPRTLPRVPGLAVASAFHPGDQMLDVGGDFYDLFGLGEDEWAFVVGDVCGHGAEAAAVTALTRHTTRAIARLAPDPADVLAFVSEALRASGYDRFCTAVYGRLRTVDGGARVRLASAGHPPPLVRRAGGSVEALEAHGPLLGVFADVEVPEVEVALAPGDALVLYTDGLIERNPRLDAGSLAEVLGAAADGPAERLLAQLEDVALGPEPRRPRDDVAVLALQAT